MEVDFTDLSRHVGQTFGPGRWVQVDQALIDRFADVTGDHNWYHVDTERAAAQMPGGLTIAHGFLTLSLVPGLSGELIRIRYPHRAVNYGTDRVRFSAPVHVGDRVRLRTTLKALTAHANGTLIHMEHVMESDRGGKPAMVCERLSLALTCAVDTDDH
ncbi:MaoC family dehydratase [Actinomadura sp. LOL_016]|uniref:MaoC family dehydratase n=1 Tax=unclassified Actinomadura TaxID=2626254 RepID=UPI003A80A92C